MIESDSSPQTGSERYTNRLIHETSPYLLLHAHNPVDWYPWGEEVFKRARDEDKPILLSVGYAACHWCHVQMAESFENERIATIMNLNYVCVKVDREERPDIDALYMDAVQALTGHGGWPMTVFLTPEGLPFYAGTYFPPEDGHGMPGFATILRRLAEFYQHRREDVREQAEEFRAFYTQRDNAGLRQQSITSEISSEVDLGVLEAAERNLIRSFDVTYGGFGAAPKFPHAMELEFLLRRHLRVQQQVVAAPSVAILGSARQLSDITPIAIVTRSLERMANGGIYDHLGGGFHRYSVDERWLVPHFEKMLYDNALLARTYLHTFQVTGNDRFARICRETLDFVRREMTSPEGGFYSTRDADSEGEEGKFYLWRPDEIGAVLDADDAALFMAVYGITARGNFEASGASVLHLARPVAEVAAARSMSTEEAERRLADARMALFAARSRRVWPALDDKIITAWNGLMLRAFAEAATVFSADTYAKVAANNAAYLLEQLRDADGRLLRVARSGHTPHIPAYLEDYANLAAGLLATYEATFEPRWFLAARELVDQMIERFDDGNGGFFDTSRDHEVLVGRPRELMDNAVPAGNSVAVEVLLWLSALTGERAYRARAERILVALAPTMAQQPLAFGYLLSTLDTWFAASREVAIIGDPGKEETLHLLAAVRARFRPGMVVACAAPEHAEAFAAVPLLADRTQISGQPTAYVCANFVCNLPVTDPERLALQLDEEW